MWDTNIIHFGKAQNPSETCPKKFCTLKNVPFLPLLQLYKQVTAFGFPYIIFVIDFTVIRDYTHSSIISIYQTLEKRLSLRKSKFMDFFFPLKWLGWFKNYLGAQEK